MSTSNYNILIFEDDIDLVFQWTLAFEEVNVKTTHVNSVDRALGLCKRQRFDAIIADMFIKEIDSFDSNGGIVLFNGLQEAAYSQQAIFTHNAKIPRIVVTGCSGLIAHTIKKLTDRLGSKRFMPKPFSPNELVAKVISEIEKSKVD